ncbi:hypothetical protein ABZT45_34630 [Streptomyces sp. NPDC005356]
MSSQMGPCAECQQPTPKYGHSANPLCAECLAPVRARQQKRPAAA